GREVNAQRPRPAHVVDLLERLAAVDACARGNERAPLRTARTVCDVRKEKRIRRIVERREATWVVVRGTNERKRRAPRLPHCAIEEGLELLGARDFPKPRRRLEPGRMREAPGRERRVCKLEYEPIDGHLALEETVALREGEARRRFTGEEHT